MEIRDVGLGSIGSNPFRSLGKYPYVERKIDALILSIEDVGLWPGVIGRSYGSGYQIAFGHHRVEAMRRSKKRQMPLIIMDLTDKEMLQYMGRENLEDYNADFLCMLETWEAAQQFLSRDHAKRPQIVEIARLLGWTKGSTAQTNTTALACNDASELIQGGYLDREDLKNLAVFSVRELCGRIIAQHEQVERMARVTKRPAKEVEQAKRHSGRAGKDVADKIRSGDVAPRKIRGELDFTAYRHAKKDSKTSPLFAMFAKSLADSIHKMLTVDAPSEKLQEIADVVGDIILDEDKAALRRIDFALAEHEITTTNWRQKLAGGGRVVSINTARRRLEDQREAG